VSGTDAHWVTYHQGEKKAYNCDPCHTTGYWNEPDTHQDGLPGIVGTRSEPGVQCEACHGPGSLHAANPRFVKPVVDRSSEQCGTCHYHGAPEVVDAKGGFIRHHDQYEELFQSKHLTLECVDCHGPHAGVIQRRKAETQTTRTLCVYMSRDPVRSGVTAVSSLTYVGAPTLLLAVSLLRCAFLH
jgi:hypothetical protein